MKKGYILKERFRNRKEICNRLNVDINIVDGISRNDWYDIDLLNGKIYSHSLYIITFKNNDCLESLINSH